MNWRNAAVISCWGLLSLLAGVAIAAEPSVFRDCAQCPEMAIVPAGTFVRSSAGTFVRGASDVSSEVLKRKQNVRAFAAGRREVSRAEFRYFLEHTGYDFGNAWRAAIGHNDTLPAVGIERRTAKAYVRWLTHYTGKPYRLLTEIEWEYAAHGGVNSRYWWGDDAHGACVRERLAASSYGDYSLCGRYSLADDAASYVSNQVIPGSVKDMRDFIIDDFAPVASLAANPFGLYDMLGNAAEWVMPCNVQTGDCREYPDEYFFNPARTGIRVAMDLPAIDGKQ